MCALPVARRHEGERLLPVLLVLHVRQEVDDLLEEVGQRPPLVLRDLARLEGLGHPLQDLARVVGKVEVSDLGRGHSDDGERLLVLLDGSAANLKKMCQIASNGEINTAHCT